MRFLLKLQIKIKKETIEPPQYLR